MSFEDPRDLGAVLRALWAQVEAPPVRRSLAEEDARTRAAVQWLRAAYARAGSATDAVAAPAVPAALRARVWALRWRRRAPALRLAAAVFLCLFAGFVAARYGARTARTWTAEAPPGEAAPPPARIAPAARLSKPASPAPVPAPAVLATVPDRVVLRAGGVRLILLQPAPDPLEE